MRTGSAEGAMTPTASREEGSPVDSNEHIMRINLKAIQRKIEETAVDIISTTSRCAMYKYVEGSWVKSGIEGSLFIYRFLRPDAEKKDGMAFTIFNKSNSNTIRQDLTDQLVHKMEPYLLFKEQHNDTNKIFGVWFNDTESLFKTYNLVDTYLKALQSGTPCTPDLINSLKPPIPFIQSSPSKNSPPSHKTIHPNKAKNKNRKKNNQHSAVLKTNGPPSPNFYEFDSDASPQYQQNGPNIKRSMSRDIIAATKLPQEESYLHLPTARTEFDADPRGRADNALLSGSFSQGPGIMEMLSEAMRKSVSSTIEGDTRESAELVTQDSRRSLIPDRPPPLLGDVPEALQDPAIISSHLYETTIPKKPLLDETPRTQHLVTQHFDKSASHPSTKKSPPKVHSIERSTSRTLFPNNSEKLETTSRDRAGNVLNILPTSNIGTTDIDSHAAAKPSARKKSTVNEAMLVSPKSSEREIVRQKRSQSAIGFSPKVFGGSEPKSSEGSGWKESAKDSSADIICDLLRSSPASNSKKMSPEKQSSSRHTKHQPTESDQKELIKQTVVDLLNEQDSPLLDMIYERFKANQNMSSRR